MEYSLRLLKQVVDIAYIAGDAILTIYDSGETETTYKDGGSPLTNADMAAHSIITENLNKITPQIPVLSEESDSIEYNTRSRWDPFWMIDPLDGTKEFINRTGEFTVNIALIHENYPVMGVVYVPLRECVYAAVKGEGAFKLIGGRDWKKRRRIKVSDYSKGQLTVVSTRSHKNELLDRFLKRIKGADIISVGSSIKLCLVAEGKAHLYPRLGPTMEWDTAAAHCIVESAGGIITDNKRNGLRYNKLNLKNPYFFVCGSPAFPWWDHMDI